MANTEWAFATAGLLAVRRQQAPLFALVARGTDRHVGYFKEQDLANSAWAFSQAGRADATLFLASAIELERRVDNLNAQANQSVGALTVKDTISWAAGACPGVLA